ncbi:6-pyruvoyl tetrahydropterin synthase family protein [Saccharicrinis sp. FJH54]|uniref:6-pyruvoyl trahydropterin synthase family protein n=1 Tax=Saccharicrinis sp. FJH54 TaxID=3344665 RepID=UPI0035D4CE5D
MAKIRVTKEFRWEMAHALWNYDGLCKNIHGHSYILYVTVIGEPLMDKSDVKDGMVIDFGDLSRIVKKEIVNKMDHSVVLNKDVPDKSFLDVEQMYDRLFLTDYQPTCENMVIDFAERIKPHLPSGVELFSVKLYETAKSFAEWNMNDN